MTTTVLAAAPLLPVWVVAPLAGATMIAVSWHVAGIQHADIPPSRKRIRTANGVLMLFVTALLTYALAGMEPYNSATPIAAQTRAFLMVWVLIIGLLPIVIGLATADALNTLRIHSARRRRLREELRERLSADLARHSLGAGDGGGGARRG